STHDSYPAFGGESVIVDGRVVGYSQNGNVQEAIGMGQVFSGYNQLVHGTDSTYVTLNRTKDEKASSQGQFGVSARYFADSLGGTEFGLYYTRTHAKLPVVAAHMNVVEAVDLQELSDPVAVGGAAAEMIDNSQYTMVYPEDIDMFGISFSSNVGPVALSGEVAYRPKQPIINDVGDNLVAGLARAAGASATQNATNEKATVGDITNHCVRNKVGGSCLGSDYEINPGERLYFYDEAKMTNASLVSIFNFGPSLGTDDLMFVLELGAEHAGGLDKNLNYASTAAMLKEEDDYHNGEDSYKSYLDTFSWGYR